MKCQPVACIWSYSPPPLHQVTATAVLNHPPTLYTGGSDGSIIWWSFSSNLSKKNVWPVAMLCGHASKIVDLDICFPVTMSGGHGEMENTTNVVVNFSSSSSAGYGALISVCTDGEKNATLGGDPISDLTLPTSPRYVCVACCSVDSLNTSSSQYSEPAEGGEASVDRESHNRRGSKCAIVVFDTYSLNIVQTVFHGSLSIGPLKFMAVVLSAENYGKQSVILGDSFGGSQSVMISKESETGSNALPKSFSQLGISASVDGLLDGEYLVSIVAHGEFLALIYRACCVFRLVGNGNVIGKMDLIDSPLCDDNPSFQSRLAAGMFLSIDDGESVLATRNPPEQFEEIFVVWSNIGAAIVFTISGSHDTFKHEPLYEIPAISHPLNTKSSVNFTQLNGSLIRVESMCYLVGESLLWKPHITMWLLCQQHDSTGKFGQQCRMLGEGGFPCNWIRNSSSLSSIFPVEKEGTLPESCNSKLINPNGMCGGTVILYYKGGLYHPR
ncbi:hypothetical protein MKX01_016806 [Papaver californicum]|nr:hypothetical protein MKX01_016806 [Papaver californicum]